MRFANGSAIAAAALGLMLMAASPPALAEHEPAPEPQPSPAPLPDAMEPWADGFYFFFDFGLGDAENPETDADFGVDLEGSIGMGFGFGYRMGPLRLEGELISRSFWVGSLDRGAASPFPDADYAGAMEAVSGMASVFVDLPTAGSMRPYLGVGYGIARVDAQYNESFCFFYCFSTDNPVVDDWDNVRARQGMLGVSFASATPGLEWYLGYRYYETEDLDFRTVSGIPFRQEGLKDHAFMVGFRFFVN
jgi:opacity protein-like surface antigen